MLILTRRISEVIMINDNVKIAILGINGNQVRLGIDAPKEVMIHREEIYERIVQERLMKKMEAEAGMAILEGALHGA